MKVKDICLSIISFIPPDSVESDNKYTTKYQLDPYITRGLRTEPPEASSFPRGPTHVLAEYPVKSNKKSSHVDSHSYTCTTISTSNTLQSHKVR